MSTKPKPRAAPAAAASPGGMQARVLCDVPTAGLRCGDIVQGPDEAVQALVRAASADPHPSAVQYAIDTGARLVLLTNPES